MSGRQRNAENRVGTQVFLVRRAIHVDHRLVNRCLIRRVHAFEGVGDLAIDVLDSFGDALAHEDGLVTVSQFPGFVNAGAGTAWHGGAASGSIDQGDFALDGRIAAAIEDLACVDGFNECHDFCWVERYKSKSLSEKGSDPLEARDFTRCSMASPERVRPLFG